MVTTNHISLLTMWNVASVTEELKLKKKTTEILT